MIYAASITTLPGRTEATATRTTLKITSGLIWLLEVDFPAGCVGLVHVQIFDGKYQLFPASPGKNFAGDGQLLTYDDLYLKEVAPFELTVVTWNEDELWTHHIQVRVGMASTRLFMARYMPSIGWQDYIYEQEVVRKAQEAERQGQIVELLDQIGEV